MNDVLSIAASGLNAAQAQLNATANNIANADTPGYKAQRADLVDIAGGGVAVQGISQGSTVDLATESVNLIREKVLYNANGAVIRATDQLTGTLLHLLDTDRDRDQR